MKKFLEEYFYKKNYFILTPKIHSFGGFFESFLFGTKIPKYIKKKTILIIPFIDTKNHYSDSPKKFDDITAGDFLYQRLVDLGLVKD